MPEEDLAVDFAAVFAVLLALFELEPDDLPADDFELEPDDLPAAFEPELDDLLPVAFEALPDDLLAVVFAAGFADLLVEAELAVFEPEDLLAVPDFAAVLPAGFAEADLFAADDDLPLADLPLDAVDFAEFLLLFFVVAIDYSLKFFLQLTKEFLR